MAESNEAVRSALIQVMVIAAQLVHEKSSLQER
jgi:hypothetical protein